MERHVKERLVGAAVLMAAAIILIPEMLSGPDREEKATPTASAREDGLKTYTIDLQPRQEGAPSEVIEERAPPAETPPEEAIEPPPAPQSNPESDVRETPTQAPAVTAAQASDERPPAPAVNRVESADAAPSRPQSQPAPMPPEPPLTRAAGWAVQIGSYSRQASADRLAGELRTAGHTAFVMPVQTGGATLYRVRVGPTKDRTAAVALLGDLKGRFPGAAVVAHP